MLAAALTVERRPSAPTTSAASTSPPSSSESVTASSPWRSVTTAERWTVTDSQALIAPRSASAAAAFGTLRPNSVRPISDASKVTVGARSKRRDPSMIRMVRSGAVAGSMASHTPSERRKRVVGPSMAVVRPSSRPSSGSISCTGRPVRPMASAAASPVSPPPTTATTRSAMIHLLKLRIGARRTDERRHRAHGRGAPSRG